MGLLKIPARVDESGPFTLLLDESDPTEYAAAFRQKWWVETSLNFILKYYPRGSKYVDFGANVGVFTLACAASGLQCLAVEPFAVNYLILHEACLLNGFRNVRLVAAAAGESPGTIGMTNVGAYARFSVDGSGPQSILLRAEDILEQESFLDADIVKCDIEGAELFAFRGLNNFFEQNQKVRVIYESNSDACKRLGYDYKDIMRFFEERGFSLYFVRQERFYKTSSQDVQPWAVADVIATRSSLPEIYPFEHAELTPAQIMTTFLEQTHAIDPFIREHVVAESARAEALLAKHEKWVELQERLAQLQGKC